MFQETDRRFKETDKWFKEEMAEQYKRHSEQFKEESRERSKEMDKVFKELAEQSKETDKKIKEVSEDIKETERVLKKSGQELDRKLGELGNRFGELAEHLVAPSINEKFNALGYHFDAIAPGGLRIDEPGGPTLAEIDLLLQNTDSMMAVEVKAKPLERHIDEHIRRLEVLRTWADRRGDRRKIHGAVAGAIFSPGVRRYALNAGFYTIVQTGDTVKIDIPPGFVPRQW
jgi:hypothetical protein